MEQQQRKVTEIEKRVKSLEDDKLIRDTTIKTVVIVFKILAWLNLAAIVTFTAALIKFLSE